MQIETQNDGDFEIIFPVGRVDTSSAKAFEDGVDVSINRAAKIIISFEKIEYISSAGLRVILMAGKKIKAKNGYMALCGMSPKIAEVFKMSGFDKILNIFNSIEEAKK